MLGDGGGCEASERGVSEGVDLAAGDVPQHGGGALPVRVPHVDVRTVLQQQLNDLYEGRGGQLLHLAHLTARS